MVNCKKLLAMFLIFTLTFSNFAFAANGFISLFGSNKKNENIEFSAYLANGEETSTAISSDVNNENMAIKMQLDVKDKGYLKDGQIDIVAEDGGELNFKIKEETKEETESKEESSEEKEETESKEESSEEKEETESKEESSEEKEEAESKEESSEEKEETESEEESSEEKEETENKEESSDAKEEVENEEEISEEKEISKLEDSDNKIESIENNIIKLRKIESSSDKLEISIPIEYVQEKYINEEKLMSKTKVILSGIYVDDNGDDNEISDEIILTLAWKDEKQVRVDNDVTKFVRFGEDGVILQTMVKIDTTSENNSLPIKSSELDIAVPTINEIAPTEITVLANKLEATTGKGIGEVKFEDDNWSYNEEEKKITINVKNEKELVKINESDDYLKEEEIKEEERYYSNTGSDEYLITYVFKNIEKSDELNIITKANAKITMFSGFDSEDDNIIYKENEKAFTLTGQTGDIVSYEVENENDSVSKVYGYLGQETEFNTKTSINVSLADIVEEIRVEDVENYYIDKSGNPLATDDIYYKEVSISKENLEEILGEEGNVEILNQEGNVLATINKDMETDENGKYIVKFEERFSKFTMKTSAPVKTGNLVISSKKAMSNLSIDKNTYANMLEIATDTVQKAKLEYVSELAELDKDTVKIALNDTKTNFNLEIDRTSLSTVTTNSDVEMRLEFNNNEEISDIYGDSVFEIEMPSYIKNVQITNASMVNGEGLELSNVESYVKDEKIIVKMTVTGSQTGINSGVLTNGTNIVLNMNIDVDMYTPSKDDVITVYGFNSQATNYTDVTNYTINDVTTCGVSQMDIEYSGPSGVVAINSLSNYNDNGKVLTSIKEGSKTDYLEIYEPARNAKSEIVVINNYDNEVSNFSILGRLPYKGVKDIDAENELGTTINTPLATMITENDRFTVYYSENENATKDLENEENNWVTEIENLENVKSYLIVPNDQEYKLGAKEVLRFSYDYTIPEELEPNQKIYGTFLVYYENNGVEEASRPDLVGLSTGDGPELGLVVSSNKDKVKELDEFTITAKVTNTGEDLASDVNLIIPVPAGTTYLSAKSDRDSAEINIDNGEVKASMVRLEKGASVELVAKFKVNESSDNKQDKIEVSAKTNAMNLRKEKIEKADDIRIVISELALREYLAMDSNREGSDAKILLFAENKGNEDKENVVVTTQLPEGVDFSYAVIAGKESGTTNYDASSNKVTWNLGTIKADEYDKLELKVKTKKLNEGVLSENLKVSSTIKSNNEDEFNAKDINIKVGKSSLSIAQASETPTYIKEGDNIDYKFIVTNSGSVGEQVKVEDIISSGITINKAIAKVDDKYSYNTSFASRNGEISFYLPENSEAEVTFEAEATHLSGEEEATIKSEGRVTGQYSEAIASNSVTNIVQKNENAVEIVKNSKNTSNKDYTPSEYATQEITKTYKILGTAWLDSNKNGMRESNEEKMSNITAILVDSDSGVIKQTTSTNNNGEYSFAGIKNGSYVVIFKYDTKKYTTTTYKKEAVDNSVNSDVVTTQIEQNGKKENAGITDTITINGSNVTGIDIGLMNATRFSLGLDKSITKVTVQNEQGTKTEKYDKAKLAKYEIRAKYLTGSTVYVEYTYTITNNGDFAGYASEIVDYIPEGMTFNSNLNKEWYTGTDGNLYTKALENSELNIGESKEVKLVLTKQMTEENTGIVSNTAEIASDYNIYGISDENSTPGNKVQNEDDMSTADLIISVGTGATLIYISAIIISLLLASGIGFIIYKRLLENKSKGGV